MMKKITLLFLFLLTVSLGYSQIVETFDPAPAAGVWISNPDEPMTTVDVVDATVDFATYGKVGRMVTDATGLPWQNAVLTMIDFKIDITTTKTITADVYYIGGAIDILGKLASGVEVNGAHPGTGWSPVTWDFTGLTGEYNTISFFPLKDGGGWIGTDGSTDLREVWIDNITAAQGSAIVADPVPATGAPIPTIAAADVISVYSDTYTSIYTDLDPNWSQATDATEVLIAGNNTLKYAGLNYQGIAYTQTDVSAMTHVHLDYWTDDATALQFFLIAGGENAYDIAATDGITTGAWIGVDIELSSAYPARDLTVAKEFKTVGNGTIYLDNLYFWKEVVDPATDATLSDLTVGGTTVAGFAPGTLTYDVALPSGTTVVPPVVGTTTQSSPATAVTTAAGSLPGASTVLVTAQDGNTKKTYTVNFTVPVPPASAAQIQPARAVADVVSVFSDEYTNVTPSGLETFGAATYTNFTVENADDTRRLTVTANGEGMQYLYLGTAPLNLTSFTTMHIDFYVEGPVQASQELQVFLVNFGAWPDGTGSTKLFKNFDVGGAIGSGAWYSAELALDGFNDTPLSRDKISLVQIVVNGGAGVPAFGPIYIDNIYFHKNTTLGLEDLKQFNFAIYPNPANDVINLRAASEIEFIEVYDITGRRVLKNTPNTKSKTLNVSGLSKGIYIVKVGIEGSVGTTKLLKQ